MMSELIIGNKYNWKNQTERLVFLGVEGAWYQCALVQHPDVIWCEILSEDLHYIESSE